MDNSIYNIDIKAGTTIGTITVLLFNIRAMALLETAILAATGALVSFCMSMLLRFIARRWQKK